MRLTSALQVWFFLFVFFCMALIFNIANWMGSNFLALIQESTANVDEWKRQLHSYKEENQRLKTKLPDDVISKSDEIADELKREIILLRNRIEGLEKELKSQDLELKTANKMIKDKSNDVCVSLTNIVFVTIF